MNERLTAYEGLYHNQQVKLQQTISDKQDLELERDNLRSMHIEACHEIEGKNRVIQQMQ